MAVSALALSTAMLSSEIRTEQPKLGRLKSEYCRVMTSRGVCEVLLARLAPSDSVVRVRDLLSSRPAEGEFFAYCLGHCRAGSFHAHKDHVHMWLMLLRETADRFMLGNIDLVRQLRDDVEAAFSIHQLRRPSPSKESQQGHGGNQHGLRCKQNFR